jgi:hypothetical protein
VLRPSGELFFAKDACGQGETGDLGHPFAISCANCLSGCPTMPRAIVRCRCDHHPALLACADAKLDFEQPEDFDDGARLLNAPRVPRTSFHLRSAARLSSAPLLAPCDRVSMLLGLPAIHKPPTTHCLAEDHRPHLNSLPVLARRVTHPTAHFISPLQGRPDYPQRF